MPPLPVIADTFRCVLNWVNTGGQYATSTWHWKNNFGGGTAAGLATQLTNNITGDLLDCISTTATVPTCTVTPLDGSSASSEHVLTGWGGSGGGVDWVPQASVIVKFQTGLRGPDHRGRIFLPFVSESNITSGNLNSGTQTAMQSAWNTFVSNMSADLWDLQVTSYAHSDTEDVTTLLVESALATQKRRQDRLRI